MIFYILFTFFILLFLTILFIGNKLCNLVVYPNIKNYEITFNDDVKSKGLENFYNSLNKEQIIINSTFGYKLNGYFINNNSKKCIIICHGIKVNLNCSIKYAELFYKRGFSILIYDHRNHGLSGGNFTSLGYYEKYDLKTCADWIFNKLGPSTTLGVFGESMGAATVLQYCNIDPRVSFCIEDCGYSDVFKLLRRRLKDDYKINSSLLILIADLIMRMRYKWSFKTASPIRYIKDLSLPILFIHGDEDDYVPTEMVYELFNSKSKGIKDLYVATGASHAASYITDPKKYDEIIGLFLSKLNLEC